MTPTTIDPTKRHIAECEPSPSGKLQWRCLICRRVTTGAERACYTVQMASKNICECGHPDFADHWHPEPGGKSKGTACNRCDCGWFRERAS